jgi:hypothetical protein
MSDNLLKRLDDRDKEVPAGNLYGLAAATIRQQQQEIEKLHKALDVYERERERFRHAKPEITGEYFLTGGHGERDANQLPQYVRICPAYGCAWEQVYEKTDRTVTYEGS